MQMVRGAAVVALVAALLFVGCSPNFEATTNEPGAYIVVLSKPALESAALEVMASQSANDSEVTAQAVVNSAMSTLSKTHGLASATKTFSRVIRGGVFDLEADQVQALREDPQVAYIERDARVSISSTQSSPPSWGLDRLDQPSLPFDWKYVSPDGGASVNAYVIDTGVLRTHVDFQGRASFGFDFVDNDQDATDCNGHGTHVAGTIAGAQYGVAKNAKIIAVRVLDCEGSGSVSGVIAGIEWVTNNHVKPAVANMSLGGGVSQAIDDAVRTSVQAGVTYVVAAGNENQNACNSSPARTPLAITVGSTTNQDVRSSFSNFGSCVDIFAPGSSITSAWFTSTTAIETISGTSMASPHVAGVAALYLAQHPTALPAEVTAKILAGASNGKVSGGGAGSPNLLLNISFLTGGTQPPPVPTPAPTPVPTPPPAEPGVTALANGVAVKSISGAGGSERFYVVTVPSGAAKLSIEISGGNGDADLHTRRGAKPTATVYDCRPFKNGNTESCSVTAPTAGKYYVRLYGYSSYSGVQLVARY